MSEGTTAEYMKLTIAQLEARHVHYVLWSARLNSPRTSNEYVPLLHDYLLVEYKAVQTFSDGATIWERK